MGENTVLESTRFLIEDPDYVFINQDKLKETAERFSQEELIIPSWEDPISLEGTGPEVIDFMFLGNSINFAYTDFESKQKFTSEYQGNPWRGAFGMWACLKKAIEQDIPILEGDYLKNISKRDMAQIFEGNIEIPMFKERYKIFKEVGRVLCQKYDGHFYNLVNQSNKRLFDDGKGIIERLTSDFPSFDDSAAIDHKRIRFDKRAQLAPAMVCGRFNHYGLDFVEDVNELTIFADYVLPKTLRDLGILVYSKDLAERVDSQQLIYSWSPEEQEIRAATIHASQMLIYMINQLRPDDLINALHMDYKLWFESRNNKNSFHQLTRTIDY